MTWSDVLPSHQMSSCYLTLGKSKVLYGWWIKKPHTPIWSLQNIYKNSHTAQCTAQWLQHVPSHPWGPVYTQIHHASRQVTPLLGHKKPILLLSEIWIISLMATKHWVNLQLGKWFNCFAQSYQQWAPRKGHPPRLDFEGFVAMMDRHHQS